MFWSAYQASSKSGRCQYCIQCCQRCIQCVLDLLFSQILYLNRGNFSIFWPVEGWNWSIYRLSASHKFTFSILETHYSELWASHFWNQSSIEVFYCMTPSFQLAANANSYNQHIVFLNRCRDFEHQSAYLICIWSHFLILGCQIAKSNWIESFLVFRLPEWTSSLRWVTVLLVCPTRGTHSFYFQSGTYYKGLKWAWGLKNWAFWKVDGRRALSLRPI